MSVYKFFRVIVDYSTDPSRVVGRIRKLTKKSFSFVNTDLAFSLLAEEELSQYFITGPNGRLQVKKNRKKPKPSLPLSNSPLDFIKLNFQQADQVKVLENSV